MKVTCDSCGTVYRIQEEKLTKEVSRATCKKCGAKLIIRRPRAGDESFEDLRVAGQGMDDDSVINHEERTVIAQVPELQNFESTPPLSGAGGVSSPDALMGLLNQRSEEKKGGENVTPSEEGPAARPAPSGAAEKPVSASPPSSAASAATGAAITSTTAPARPSGEAPQSPPPKEEAPAQPPPRAQRAPNPVDIFASQASRAAAQKDVPAPASPVPLVMLAVALIGVLAFIDQALWSLTRVTAVGFFVAIYGILAALLAQLYLNYSSRINFVTVFLVPAIACLGLAAILFSVQKEDLVFVNQEISVDLVKRYIVHLPQAPRAEKTSKAPLRERVARAQRKWLPPSKKRNKRETDVPSVGELRDARASRADGGGGLKGEGASNGLDVSNPDGLRSIVSTRGQKRVPPTRIAMAGGVSEADKRAFQKVVESTNASTCFSTSTAGSTINENIDFEIVLSPKGGKPITSHVANTMFKESKLERCLRTKIEHATFPGFDSSENFTYSYRFYVAN